MASVASSVSWMTPAENPRRRDSFDKPSANVQQDHDECLNSMFGLFCAVSRGFPVNRTDNMGRTKSMNWIKANRLSDLRATAK